MVEVVEVKVRPVGNALGVILPSAVVKAENLKAGKTILVSILKKRSVKELEVFASLKGVTPFERDHSDRF